MPRGGPSVPLLADGNRVAPEASRQFIRGMNRLMLCLMALPLALRGAPAGAEFAEKIRPFLNEHCTDCHGEQKQKGKLRLDTLSPDFSDPGTAEKWAEVVRSVNSHQMPPEEEPQPDAEAAGAFTEWLSARLGEAEIAKRSTTVVMRRMNRAEYNNTIRDLCGVDIAPADRFPEDGAAGGFDNVGQALSISPLHMELYYQAAQQVLDKALQTGPRPAGMKWRFEVEDDKEGSDRTRLKRDGQNVLLNSGNNPKKDGMVAIHHASWDKGVGFRDFTLPAAGRYTIRFRAAGRVPDRAAVVSSAAKILAERRDKQKKEKNEARHADAQYENDLAHFRSHRMYDYGPPRAKIIVSLGGQPQVVSEMDVSAAPGQPDVYEVTADFTTEKAGIQFEYAYSIPRELENFWMQDKAEFARPELLIDWIELEGPVLPEWPPASTTAIVGAENADEPARARSALERFMRRAWRRPVTAEEVAAKLAIFQRVRPECDSFTGALKAPLTAVLASPHFLYLVEPETPGTERLDAHQLAVRLSYFLWSSMPDEALFRAAEDGSLLRPAELVKQADRMLKDDRSSAFVRNFAGQWLGLRKVGSNPPAEALYPDYDRHLEVSMVQESESFFAEILQHDLDARNLLRSGFVTINERLARFYCIPGVRGDHFRRVPVLPEHHRGGIVTQASIHTITSNGTRTSPVSRGTWIMKTLLGLDPGLPVANAGEIAPKVPGIDKATVRQRLEIHRQVALCARCHNRIDPLGFALENYDACGEWRDQEGHGYNGRVEKDDPKIDASSKMIDGTEITGVAGLQAELLRKEDLFFRALTEKLMIYALGRETGFSDQPAIRKIAAAEKGKPKTLRSIIHGILQSEQFARP